MFIKAKFLKCGKTIGRAYTYQTDDEVKPGDIVKNSKGARLMVMNEIVDEEWIDSYSVDKIGIVWKCKEPVYRIVQILDAKTKEPREDGRYPERIGRVVKRPAPCIGSPMLIEYLKNADGSDYSGNYLRTSLVLYESIEDGKLIVNTVNSTYIFEEIESEE